MSNVGRISTDSYTRTTSLAVEEGKEWTNLVHVDAAHTSKWWFAPSRSRSRDHHQQFSPIKVTDVALCPLVPHQKLSTISLIVCKSV